MIKILLFSATWCAPCQTLKGIVAKCPEFDVEVVDIEDDPDRAALFGVRSVPMLVKLQDDEAIDIRNGANMNETTFRRFAA